MNGIGNDAIPWIDSYESVVASRPLCGPGSENCNALVNELMGTDAPQGAWGVVPDTDLYHTDDGSVEPGTLGQDVGEDAGEDLGELLWREALTDLAANGD